MTLPEPGARPDGAPARAARHGDRATLAALLRASRADTLATFAVFEQALPGLRVPQRDELNPPLWELGHIGWFQGWWTTRFPAWRQGPRADPGGPRRPALRPDAEALYDSSSVPHATRWALPLPDAATTRAELAQQLEATLALLADAPDDADDTLYAFRLALLHEDMHHEAALYMALGLGLPVADARWQPRPLPAPPAPLRIEGAELELGRDPAAPGFAFDNELGRRRERVAAFAIDAQALRWDEFLPFLRHGHAERRWWSEPGWAWRQQQGSARCEALQARCHSRHAGRTSSSPRRRPGKLRATRPAGREAGTTSPAFPKPFQVAHATGAHAAGQPPWAGTATGPAGRARPCGWPTATSPGPLPTGPRRGSG